MKKGKVRFSAFRTFSGAAASLAIVYLLAELGQGALEAKTIACGCVAAISLASAIIEPKARRAEKGRLHCEDFGLTAREKEFFLAFMGGTSMKQIAIDRGLSPSTVRNTFSSVYKKMGVSGSAELAALGADYELE